MRIIAMTIIGLAVLFQSSAQSEYCGVGTVWDAESQTCIAVENAELLDSNLDGIIGVEDLLNLLSHFGDEDMDFDGIYDSVDDCVGAYDECGVCNGDGPQIPIIDEITVLYDSLYAEAIDEWWVFEVGIDTAFTFVCEIIEGCTDANASNFSPLANMNEGCIYYEGCGDISSISYYGTTYNLIDINGQCWFQTNLKTSQFQDGTWISQVSETQWQTLSDYNNDELTIQYPAYATPLCDNSCSANGYVYNSLVWNSELEVCPSGFRVPIKSDFEYLIGPYSEHLGELKATWGWEAAGAYEASNVSGFTAIATGTLGGSYTGDISELNGASSSSRFAFKVEDATFHDAGVLSLTSYSYSNGLTNEGLVISRSIRCIKDTE